MCMIDNADEQYIVWNHHTVKRAVKEHKCNECRRVIHLGESYEYYSCGPSVSDHGWDIFKVCRHCQVACEWLNETCNGFLHECVLEDIEEHASSYKQIGLYRLVIGMHRKWARKDGQVMKLPLLPQPIKI